MAIEKVWSLFYIYFYTALALQRRANYGYIGPACAVAEGRLYLHGEPQRDLSASEQEAFRLYQRDLSIFLELKKKFRILEPPKMPAFCGQLTDAAELVLQGCIVRDGKVYINSNLVRLLTDEEEDKIDNVMGSLSRGMRKMRDSRSNGPGFSPLRDISIFLDRFLKVSPAVTRRFAPWLEQSPLISGKEAPPGYGTVYHQSSHDNTTSAPQKTTKISGYNIKRRLENRWDAKFTRSAPPLSAPILPSEQGKSKSEKTAPSTEHAQSTGQTLLQLLTKTLTDPELMRTLKELEQMPALPARTSLYAPRQNFFDRENHTVQEPEYLPHPVMQWFAKYTEKPERMDKPSILPDEICTAHMKPPKAQNRRRNMPF